MIRFLKNIFFFFIPIIGASFVLDSFFSTKLKQQSTLVKGEYDVWDDIFEGKIKSDIIIIGSSRAWVHFNPSIITDKTKYSAYNIGLDGHPFFLQKTRFDVLKKYNKNPKLLIVSLESNSLFKRPDLYNHHQFLPYLRSNKEDLKKDLLQFKGFNSYDFELPLTRFYGNFYILKELFLNYKNTSKIRTKGFKGEEKEWTKDFKKAKKKYNSINVKVDEITSQKFKNFIKENIKEDINVVLVYSPEYIEGQNFISNRDSIVDIYKNISKDNSIPFIDFSKDSICYKKKYFYNATHLNKKGANLFTNKLIDTLKERKLIPLKK